MLATLEKLPSSQQREALDILQLTISHELHGGTPEVSVEESSTGPNEFNIPGGVHNQQSLSLGGDKLHESQEVIGLDKSNSHQQTLSGGSLQIVHQQNVIEAEGILPPSQGIKKENIPLSHQQNVNKNHSHELQHTSSLEGILPQELNVARTPDPSLISLESFSQAHAPDLATVHNTLHHVVGAHSVQCLQQPPGVLSQQTENLTAELETFDRAQQAAAKRNRLQEAAEIACSRSQEITPFRDHGKLGSETQDSSDLESLLHQHEEMGREILQEQDSSQDFHGSETLDSPEHHFHSADMRTENVKSELGIISQESLGNEKDNITASGFIPESERNSLFSEQEPYVFNFKLDSERNRCPDIQYGNCSMSSKKQLEALSTGDYFSNEDIEKGTQSADQTQEELVSLNSDKEIVDAEKRIREIVTDVQESSSSILDTTGMEQDNSGENSNVSTPVERRSLRKRKCKNKNLSNTVKEKKLRRNNSIDHVVQERGGEDSVPNKRLSEDSLQKEDKENHYQQSVQNDLQAKETIGSSADVSPTASLCNDIGAVEAKESVVNQSDQVSSLQTEPGTNEQTDPNLARSDGDGSWPPTLRPVSCRSCKKELPDVSLFSVHLRQCEGHLMCTYCQAKFVHKVCL